MKSFNQNDELVLENQTEQNNHAEFDQKQKKMCTHPDTHNLLKSTTMVSREQAV